MKLIRHLNEHERAIIAIVSVMLMVTGMLIYLLLAPPVTRAWSSEAKANVGTVRVPAGLVEAMELNTQ